MRLHHVQVACPPGGEDVARRFWVDGLGLSEVDKPADLAVRGGAWFRAQDSDGAVTLEIHVGVEDSFTPARKAHPGVLLDDVSVLESTGARLETLGFDVDWSQRRNLPGFERLHVRDGHGNRVEILARRAGRLDRADARRGGSTARWRPVQDDPSSEAGGTPPEGPTRTSLRGLVCVTHVTGVLERVFTECGGRGPRRSKSSLAS